MNPFTIHHLKITNFKSIDSLTLRDVQAFSVFAGANGSGKSNFFDALNFVSVFIRSGINEALRKYGGYEQLHSHKRRKEAARRFDFEIDVTLAYEEESDETVRIKYILNIHNLDDTPRIAEEFHVNNSLLLKRKIGDSPKLLSQDNDDKDVETPLKDFPSDYSALMFWFDKPFGQLLRNIRLYRIDPISSKEPDNSDQDPTALASRGDNLASVLGRMEKNEELADIILEWMETIVPSVEKINTERQKLDSRTAILFKESGTKRQFPANMVSDGTIYALSLLVAVLDAPKHSLILIEEPERGLHPKAIQELVGFIRERSCFGASIWMTTHSEAVVRALELKELWLVDKREGKSRFTSAVTQGLSDEDFAPLGLDKAWLADFLNGGLPW
ncbi:MAG: AAA family ATPase [Methylococcaceae bacterium]|nr:AAA family ATPase [Methylococcaceae bacterium]